MEVRLLVLGASIANVPFIKCAKRIGCYVGAVDYDENAPAIEFADEYFKCSLLDVEGVHNIAKTFRANGITCGASDVGVITASEVCDRMGLPGLSMDTAIKVKDKGAMIKAFEEAGVAHPNYQLIESPQDVINIEYPYIVKPVDNSGSRGINVVHIQEEVEQALLDSFSNSRVKKVIVEEYMEGPEVSVEVLIQNGEPYILQVTDKLTSGEPHFIEIGHSQPSQLPETDIMAIHDLAYRAAKSVGLQNGCAHAEMRVTPNGPKMIEIAGRMGGDFITTILLPTSTGIDLSEYEILRALGKPKTFDPESIKQNRGVAVRFIEARPGRVNSVELDYLAEEMIGIEEIKFVCKTGVVYSESQNNNDRFGYVIATGKTPAIALNRCGTALKRVTIEMEPV